MISDLRFYSICAILKSLIGEVFALFDVKPLSVSIRKRIRYLMKYRLHII